MIVSDLLITTSVAYHLLLPILLFASPYLCLSISQQFIICYYFCLLRHISAKPRPPKWVMIILIRLYHNVICLLIDSFPYHFTASPKQRYPAFCRLNNPKLMWASIVQSEYNEGVIVSKIQSADAFKNLYSEYGVNGSSNKYLFSLDAKTTFFLLVLTGFNFILCPIFNF